MVKRFQLPCCLLWEKETDIFLKGIFFQMPCYFRMQAIMALHKFLFFICNYHAFLEDSGMVSNCFLYGSGFHFLFLLNLLPLKATLLLFNPQLGERIDGFMSFPGGICAKVNTSNQTGIVLNSTFHAENSYATFTSTQRVLEQNQYKVNTNCSC